MSGEAPTLRRCFGTGDPAMEAYHDAEWGVPVRDDRLLFEHLLLDMFQAGLSWRTILHKREAFRRAFAGFDPERIARFGARERRRLLADAGIVRNRLKIEAAIHNAGVYLRLREQDVSFSEFLWSFAGGRRRRRRARSWSGVPTTTPQAEAMARALREHGFRFAGPTVCYAFMQAVGMVDDHLASCFRARELDGARR